MNDSSSGVRRISLTVFAIAILALGPMLALSSSPASAAGVNLTVYGYVLDNMGNPVEGAGVLVEVLSGTTPSRSDTTNSDGLYTVDFNPADWNVGDTVRTTATYLSVQDSDTAIAPIEMVALMQIDVQFATEIPEFGSFFGVAVAMVLVGSVAVISMRRRRTQ